MVITSAAARAVFVLTNPDRRSDSHIRSGISGCVAQIRRTPQAQLLFQLERSLNGPHLRRHLSFILQN